MLRSIIGSDMDLTTGGGSGSGIEPQYEAEPTPNTDAAEGTTFYDVTSTDYADGGFSNCTFHDFTVWIRREGGINELLSMLVPTNQPTSYRNQVKPEAEDVRNWIIPVIPLDCTYSPVVRDLDHVIDEPLRKGSIFYIKEDIYAAVGLWHMEHKVEFKVSHSYGSRVKYCKHNPSCTFELHASWRGSY
ncbi:hypothetical protein C2S52_013413 [Perilla frutescens var. hirtella]|nr:hypothetical protein C2S52_013413 [Perilla frutescens var. hirtella]